MDISAQTTTTALRTQVFPILKAAGFDDCTSRKAWRRRKGSVDCVEFRSFNAYNAEVLCCTTASVSVWFGSSPSFIVPLYPFKDGPKGSRPHECEMPIRGQLAPLIRHSLVRPDLIWLIEDEKDTNRAATEIAAQFLSYDLAWLSKEWDAKHLIDLLIEAEGYAELERAASGASQYIEAGNGDSPHRNRMIAQLAVVCGNNKLAAIRYERARWTRNMKTGERYLFLSAEDDRKLLELSAHYENLV